MSQELEVELEELKAKILRLESLLNDKLPQSSPDSAT